MPVEEDWIFLAGSIGIIIIFEVINLLNAMYNILFKELYYSYCNIIKDSRYSKKKYCLMYPCVGEYYRKSKFLFVGRAVNGWNTQFVCNRKNYSIVIKSIKASMKEKTRWIEDNEKGLNEYYNGNRSRFLKCCSRVLHEVTQKNIMMDSHWSKHIAWSNLMKIAPSKGGNPTDRECYAQLDICRDLFKLELDLLKPRFAFIFTGLNWFDNGDFTFVSPLGIKLKFVKDKVVKAIGTYKRTQLIITERPDNRREGFTNDMFVKSFKKYIV